ncbi:single-stranded-DNA-specific exonuclease RecJ [Haliovirga abyssi]|uniref:Single-stranded-DNA-specific exonuclease RecJ n=1 Tax=Haliovirga abyssi TaxID=2996794 RepID=A0AAU9D2S4_9FUSO|nr:single-stranded-DNA-specific exonuclease RecJ [Haliovirga abyssi]BDU50299.1 single-stranded-DNA-specific exonuclease RecJ [Haliovirga abyssi]
MKNTRWIYKEKNIKNIPEEIKKININQDILSIIYNRGITSKEKIINFLNPDINNISNPLLLKDVDEATNFILKSMQNNKKIWIYGDYDVDGITSSSLMVLAFRKLGYDIEYYIPLREEGYGLNKEALAYIKEQGGDLVITVDCGISSVDEVQYANSIGLNVIITDHHEINNNIPPAVAVINPKRIENSYEFKSLAGVGTAFMLVLNLFKANNIKEEAYSLLYIVAIGTVADIVPLKEENRIFVKHGLKLLNSNENIGLKVLLKKLFENYATKKFNTYDIGFIIAPTFNAAGRLDDAKKGVALFTTTSIKEAEIISNDLIENNFQRKSIQKTIYEKVENEITKNHLSDKYVIVVSDTSFHHGVIGIVASKITDKYYKPTIIMELKDDGTAVASARSIEGFNIIEALIETKDLLIRFGGHEGAAGFSILQKDIPLFEEKINEVAKNRLSSKDLIKPIKIDKTIFPYDISYEFFNVLKKLEPFGFGNPKPIFATNNVSLKNIRLIGKDRSHLSFDIETPCTTHKSCVWFGEGELKEKLDVHKKYNIAFKLDISEFKDKYYTKVYTADIVESKKEYSSKYNYYNYLYNYKFPIKTIIYTKHKIDISDKLYIKLDKDYSSIPVYNNKEIIGFFNETTSKLILNLNELYNKKFDLKISNITKTDSNFQILIDIIEKKRFETYSYKPGVIFKEIKNFLIGDFEYNSFQKKVLSEFIKNKKNIMLPLQEGVGINTIILSIGIYYWITTSKKSILITEKKLDDIFYEYFDIVDSKISIKNKYNFAVYYDVIPKVINNDTPTIITLKKIINIKNFENIINNIEIPENIIIVDDNNVESLEKDNKKIFYIELPNKLKKEIISNLKNNMKNNEKIYSTNDIKLFL